LACAIPRLHRRASGIRSRETGIHFVTGDFSMTTPTTGTTPSPVNQGGVDLSSASATAAGDIKKNNTAQNDAYMGLLDQSTAQTLQIQTALLNHNLTVGPVMAAKSASEDAKKT
jgi:hypothetical protein